MEGKALLFLETTAVKMELDHSLKDKCSLLSTNVKTKGSHSYTSFLPYCCLCSVPSVVQGLMAQRLHKWQRGFLLREACGLPMGCLLPSRTRTPFLSPAGTC